MTIIFDKSKMAMALLNGLPKASDPLISPLGALSGDERTLKLDHVKSRVLQEERRVDTHLGQAALMAGTSALISNQYQRKGERPKCSQYKMMGHVEEQCWKRNPHLNPRMK